MVVKSAENRSNSLRSLVLFVLTTVLASTAGCGSTAVKDTRNSIPSDVPDVPAGAELSTAMTAFESGNFGFSAKYFEMAAKKSPNDMTACLGMAASFDWLYRFDLADRAYGKCSKIGKDNFTYHNNVGFSYLLRGDYGKASVSFARAKQLRPGDPTAENNLRILRDAASG